MDLDDSNESSLDLVDMANIILNAFNSSKQITEEDLYSDEFYISVFLALMSDEEEVKIDPGQTPEEKIENMKLIVANLAQLFQGEIPDIDVKKIILKKDKENARKLVEIFFTMIQMLIQEKMNLEEEKGDTDEEIKSHSFNDNRMNLSEKKETEKMRRNKDEEINLENLESLRLGKDKDKKKEKKEEEKEPQSDEEEEKIIGNSTNKKKSLNDEDDEMEINDVNNNIKGSSSKKKEDEESPQKSLKKGENNNNINKEPEKESEKSNRSIEIDISENSSPNKNKNKRITDSEKESGKKKSNEIPNLLDGEENKEDNLNIIQKAKNQLEDIRLSDQESSDSRFNNTEKRKAHSVSQSLPKLYNPNPDEDNDNENEMDFENYNDNEENELDYDYNEDKKMKKSDSASNSNLNIENSTYKKSNEDKDINGENELENNTKSQQQSSQKKKDTKKNTTNKKKEKDSTNKKSSNKKDNELEQQSSKKKENSDKKNTQDIDQEIGQKPGIVDNPEQKNSQEKEEEENEEPLIEEEYRYEIMKQFKKIYGDKLDNIFLKHNMENSKNVFELALRNIKLAKQKMMKIENRYPEVDDLKTKEYILRYEKERQMMEAHYNKEQKKINFFEERAINNFKQNLKDMKKAKEIEARKTENEIERRRKAQEVRNYHNQVKFCNEIYQRALELEKEKRVEKMKKKREQNKKENEEKREAMERIENYYKDKIKILREILENEKKQKEIEHRAHIKFLSTFAKEKRDEYRKELDNIFVRFEQEEKRNEFERKNKKELNKIFDSYYGK